MRKDPTQFRERFRKWKNGEQVYDAGLPKYEMGKDDEVIRYETEQPASYYYPEDKDLISRVANTLTDSKGNILERTLPELTVTAPRRGLFGRRTPSSSYVSSMSDEAVDREGRQQSTLNNRIRAAQNEVGYGTLQAAKLAATFTPLAPAVFGGELIGRAYNQGWGMFKDPMTYLDILGVIPGINGAYTGVRTAFQPAWRLGKELMRDAKSFKMPTVDPNQRYYTTTPGGAGSNWNYHVVDAEGYPIGEGTLNSAFDGSGNRIGWVSNISRGRYKGASRSVYNAMIHDSKGINEPGIISGEDLMSPAQTIRITNDYPHVVLGEGSPAMQNRVLYKPEIRLLTGTNGEVPLRIDNSVVGRHQWYPDSSISEPMTINGITYFPNQLKRVWKDNMYQVEPLSMPKSTIDFNAARTAQEQSVLGGTFKDTDWMKNFTSDYKDTFKRLEKMQYRTELEGVDPIEGVPIPESYKGTRFKSLPDWAKEEVWNSTYPRMKEQRPWMSDDALRQEFEQAMDGGYTSVPQKTMDKALGKEGYAGVYMSDVDKISVVKGNEDFALPHEIRHKIDNHIPLTAEETKILNKAYNEHFDELDMDLGAGMDAERVTTNRDAREVLLGSHHNMNTSHVVQNKIIDRSSDNSVINAVRNANGYGSKYIQKLEDLGLLKEGSESRTVLVQHMKEAMKAVGISSGAMYFGSRALRQPTITQQ